MAHTWLLGFFGTVWRSVASEALVPSQASLCGICGIWSDTSTRFLWSLSFYECSIC